MENKFGMKKIQDGMVHLRELKDKDSQGMLEWMHDKDVQKCFQRNMGAYTEEDVLNFIATSRVSDERVNSNGGLSFHYAVANNTNDEYLGTVSLKNVNRLDNSAEYAISMRKVAHGTGAACEATKQVLFKAFNELQLNRVYLNVLSENIRAIRFYEKMGFVKEGEFRQALFKAGKYMNLMWYSVLKSDYINSDFVKLWME